MSGLAAVLDYKEAKQDTKGPASLLVIFCIFRIHFRVGKSCNVGKNGKWIYDVRKMSKLYRIIYLESS
jgi:hypothetical protein